MPAIQVRNADQMSLLNADLQNRYEPNFAWGCAGAFQQLLGLRGWWSMGSVSDVPEAIDQGGQGRHLSIDGNPQWRIWDLAPYAIFINAGDNLYRLDEAGLDTLGLDWQHQVNRGVTAGCWVQFSRPIGSIETILSKNGAAGDYSWLLRREATGAISFMVSVGGAVYTTITSTAITAQNIWYFVAGRMRLGAGIDVFVNRDLWTNAVAIAGLFNSAAPFAVGMSYDPLNSNGLRGFVSNAFLCAAAQNDLQMATIYEMTRAMYSA